MSNRDHLLTENITFTPISPRATKSPNITVIVNVFVYLVLSHQFYSSTHRPWRSTHPSIPRYPENCAVKANTTRTSAHMRAFPVFSLQLYSKDTAKSTFDAGRRLSYIDLNRAGTGLMEIVSEPDMTYGCLPFLHNKPATSLRTGLRRKLPNTSAHFRPYCVPLARATATWNKCSRYNRLFLRNTH